MLLCASFFGCSFVILVTTVSITDAECCTEPVSLLAMWTSRINTIHRDRCREFSGRLEAGPGNKAELYQHMKDDSSLSVIQCPVSCNASVLPRYPNRLIDRSNGGTAAAAPPPIRPGNPALCGSCPLVTPY